jgi:thiol peroxidase
MLFARSVIVVDKQGIVRYIQVVPEMTHLPDMKRAFQVAVEMVKQG